MSRWVVAACLFPVAVTVTAACSRRGGSDSPAHTESARRAAAADLELRQELRRLWSDHVIWMRGFIVSTAADLPDAQAASERLQKNQEEIGACVGRYYGRAMGDQLAALLKEHVWSTVEFLRAMKAGDEGAESRAEERGQRNAAQIADFLSQANPNWSRGRLYDLLTDRLMHVRDEIDERVSANWSGDVKAFDASRKQALRLADAFSDGIIRQYPDKFGG
jgi:hypothetical protein